MFSFTVQEKKRSKGIHRLKPKFTPFAYETGPPSIAEIAKAFTKNQSLKTFQFSSSLKTKTNSSLIACAIVMQKLDISPKRALKLLGIQRSELEKYRDASSYPNCKGTISVLHCLKALKLGVERNILPFPLDSFPIAAWNFWEEPANGDFNWIVKRKIIAFAAPVPENSPKIAAFFHKNDIGLVVRCSEETKYNAKDLYGERIKVTNIYFPDGSVPTQEQAWKFIREVESALPNPVAVHCKAGLGRTGTLICCWLMLKEEFTAKESIAYVRMMRPGSVSAYQEHWLLNTWTKISKC
jgi:cell division cycle 14